MCLSRVTVKRRLEKAEVVYKVVCVSGDYEWTGLNLPVIAGTRHVSLVNRLNHSNPLKDSVERFGYEVGFHGYLKRKDCKDLLKWLRKSLKRRHELHKTTNAKILKFIIPAGTIVQCGYEYTNKEYCQVIVSPVLINPRVKPELSESTIEDYGITEAEVVEASIE